MPGGGCIFTFDNRQIFANFIFILVSETSRSMLLECWYRNRWLTSSSRGDIIDHQSDPVLWVFWQSVEDRFCLSLSVNVQVRYGDTLLMSCILRDGKQSKHNLWEVLMPLVGLFYFLLILGWFSENTSSKFESTDRQRSDIDCKCCDNPARTGMNACTFNETSTHDFSR